MRFEIHFPTEDAPDGDTVCDSKKIPKDWLWGQSLRQNSAEICSTETNWTSRRDEEQCSLPPTSHFKYASLSYLSWELERLSLQEHKYWYSVLCVPLVCPSKQTNPWRLVDTSAIFCIQVLLFSCLVVWPSIHQSIHPSIHPITVTEAKIDWWATNCWSKFPNSIQQITSILGSAHSSKLNIH